MSVRVICDDGVERAAQITGYADSAFSMPARVKVRRNGKQYTVTGFITPADGLAFMQDHEPSYLFHAYKYRKNHAVIVETAK